MAMNRVATLPGGGSAAVVRHDIVVLVNGVVVVVDPLLEVGMVPHDGAFVKKTILARSVGN